jgi:hypothetical protein
MEGGMSELVNEALASCAKAQKKSAEKHCRVSLQRFIARRYGDKERMSFASQISIKEERSGIRKANKRDS